MNSEIKQRIEQMKNGEVPEGYSHTKMGIFPDDWTVVSFDEKFNRLDRKNDEDNQNVLTISAQQGLISQEDYYTSSYASENKKGYSLLYKGDFSYNKSYSGDYLYGAIKRLDKYEKGIVSPLYICFEPKEGTNSEFYLQYFEAGLFNGEIYKIAQEGARNHGLLNVSVTDFFKTHLVNPSSDEQQKIAEILTQCDKVIELKQKRIVEEKKLKRWIMKQLFNYANDKFDKKQIKDITEYIDYRGKTPRKVKFGVFLVTAKNIRMGYIDYEASKEYVAEDDYELVMRRGKPKIGDVVITTEAPCGNVAQIDDTNIALAQRIILLRAKKEITNEYLCYCLQSHIFQEQINMLKTGLTAQGIKGETLHKIKIPIPNATVQSDICCKLKTCNLLIDRLEKELEQWQQKKKSLMQLLLTGIVRCEI